MAIFLTILKVLLWILLIVLGIALALILILLFAPIRYRISGEVNDEVLRFDAKVSFLILSVLGGFNKKDGLDYQAKLLWFKVYPRKGKQTVPAVDFDDAALLESSSGTQEGSSQVQESSSQVQESSSGIQDSSSNLQDSSSGGSKKKFGFSLKKDRNKKDKKTESVADSNIQSIDQTGESPAAEVGPSEPKSFGEKISEKGELVAKKAEAVQTKIDKISASIEKLQLKIDHFTQFMDKPFTQKTITRGKKLIATIFKSVKPKKSRAFIRFGMSNAAATGEMLGKLCWLYPFCYKWLILQPDFYEKGFEGDIDISGRIRLGFIIIPALFFVISRDFRRTYKLAKKI